MAPVPKLTAMLPIRRSANDRPIERTVSPPVKEKMPKASNLKGPRRFVSALTTRADDMKASVGSESKTPAI